MCIFAEFIGTKDIKVLHYQSLPWKMEPIYNKSVGAFTLKIT